MYLGCCEGKSCKRILVVEPDRTQRSDTNWDTRVNSTATLPKTGVCRYNADCIEKRLTLEATVVLLSGFLERVCHVLP